MKKFLDSLGFRYRKKSNKSKFILISIQRSGSTYLADLLTSHQYIYMGQELFKIDNNKINVDENNYRYFRNKKDITSFLDDFFQEKLQGHQAVGFKIMLNQLMQFPEIVDYMKNNNVKCIYLERKNQLKIAVSRFKARKTQMYHTTDKVNQKKIEIDPLRLCNELKFIDESIKKSRELNQSLHGYELFYESLLLNKKKEIKKLLLYLDIAFTGDLVSSLKKINSDRLSDVILNYDEIKTALSTSNFAKYLDH